MATVGRCAAGGRASRRSQSVCRRHWGWEPIELNPVYTGLVAGNIFLLGFLLSGVLSDFKEAEKLPVELTASLESIADEFLVVKKLGRGAEGEAGMRHISATVDAVLGLALRDDHAGTRARARDGSRQHLRDARRAHAGHLREPHQGGAELGTPDDHAHERDPWDVVRRRWVHGGRHDLVSFDHRCWFSSTLAQSAPDAILICTLTFLLVYVFSWCATSTTRSSTRWVRSADRPRSRSNRWWVCRRGWQPTSGDSELRCATAQRR